MTLDKTHQHIKLDERNHVEEPLLDQLAGLGWEILDLDGFIEARSKAMESKSIKKRRYTNGNES
ncbi:MAG: hypothetical protein WA126_12605 [Thermodesulfovibrionales bacterium]